MRTIILTTALCLVGHAAMAGGSGHEGMPTPTASPTYNTAAAGAAALSRSAARSSATATGGAARATGGRASAATGPVTVNNSTGGGGYGGGGYSARGNTPDVILPAVSGGNPCGLAAGAGGSLSSFGAMVARMWEGDGCETREGAKLLYNMGYDAAAKNRLCEDTRYSTAFADAGQPCEADVRRWIKEGWRR